MLFRSLVIVALLIALTPLAHAQDAAAQAEARVLFDEGAKLLAEGRAAEACPKLEASLRRYPGLGTHGKLAECYEAIGRTASAWALYRKVMALAAERNDAARERVARERAQALEPKLAYLTITVPSRVPGLTVTAGGSPVEEAVFGTRVARDPGTLAVEATAPGYLAFRRDVMVEPAKTAELTIELQTDPNPQPVPGGGGPTTPEEDERPWQMPLGVAVLCVGGASLVVGGVLAGVAKSTWDGAFENGCDAATLSCDAAGFDETEKARTFADASTGLIIAGAILAAGGIALWITAPGYPAEIGVAPTSITLRTRF